MCTLDVRCCSIGITWTETSYSSLGVVWIWPCGCKSRLHNPTPNSENSETLSIRRILCILAQPITSWHSGSGLMTIHDLDLSSPTKRKKFAYSSDVPGRLCLFLEQIPSSYVPLTLTFNLLVEKGSNIRIIHPPLHKLFSFPALGQMNDGGHIMWSNRDSNSHSVWCVGALLLISLWFRQSRIRLRRLRVSGYVRGQLFTVCGVGLDPSFPHKYWVLTGKCACRAPFTTSILHTHTHTSQQYILISVAEDEKGFNKTKHEV